LTLSDLLTITDYYCELKKNVRADVDMEGRLSTKANVNEMVFHNSQHSRMTFDEMFSEMLSFIRKEPTYSYQLIVGTDSQVTTRTLSQTGVVLRKWDDQSNMGRGAFGCLRTYIVPRRITSLREKISMETSLSEEVACLFTTEKIGQIVDILLPYVDRGANFKGNCIHLDIGEFGATRELIKEMTARIRSLGFEPEIKPESYVASGYANHHTK
jgi:predicted RNase H-related nuclease YkuK (DUF458 family)